MQRLVALFLVAVAFQPLYAAGPYFATAVSVNGKVYIGKKLLKPGDKVLPGEVIHTNSDASIKLLLVDKSILDLGPSTNMRLEDPARAQDGVTASLETGSLRSLVQKRVDPKNKFSIKTKASVLAVRGTEFVVRITGSPGTFRQIVTVAKGEIFAADRVGNQNFTLTPGRQLDLSGTFRGTDLVLKEPPKVLNLNPGQLAEIVKAHTVEDHTFRQEIEITNKNKDEKRPDERGPSTDKNPDERGRPEGEGNKDGGGPDKGPGGEGPDGKPSGSNGRPGGGGSSTISSIAEGVQDQFGPGRGPASEGGFQHGHGEHNRGPRPPTIDPLTQLSPDLAKGAVDVRITIAP